MMKRNAFWQFVLIVLGSTASFAESALSRRVAFTPTWGSASYHDSKLQLSTPLESDRASVQVRQTALSSTSSEWAEKLGVELQLNETQKLEPSVTLSQGTGIDNSAGLGLDYSLDLNEIDSTLLLGFSATRYPGSTVFGPSLGFEHFFEENCLLGATLSFQRDRDRNHVASENATATAARLGSTSQRQSRVATLYASYQPSDAVSIDPSVSISKTYKDSSGNSRTLALASTVKVTKEFELVPEVSRTSSQGTFAVYTGGLGLVYLF